MIFDTGPITNLCGPAAPELRSWLASIITQISAARLRNFTEQLPAPRNRLHAPEAMARAEQMIAQGFHEAGWAVRQHPYEWRNVLGAVDYAENGFPPGARETLYEKLTGKNILALKEGDSADIFVVGAHFNTIRDSPGADDNTASVAALLELARLLTPYRFHNTIVLAAFDMEELNFFGSAAFVKQISRERKLKGAIIFETMAYTNSAPNSQSLPPGLGVLYPSQMKIIRQRKFAGDWTVVVYRQFATALAQAFAEGMAGIEGPNTAVLMRDPADLPVIGGMMARMLPSAAYFSRSDHLCFWEAGIPAIMISDTADLRNPHYHQPSDTPDTLNYSRLAAIVGATAYSLARVAEMMHP